jgi:WD40 repeat protein
MAIVAEKTEFWDISGEPKILDKQPKPASLSYSVAFSPDGRYLVAPSEEGMKLWNAKARKWDLLPGGLENANWLGVAISPDKTVASSGKSGTIVIWDLGSATELTTAYAGKSVLKAMAFSPDGKSLYTLGEDWQIYTHPAHTKDLIVEATEQIAAGKGPWVLNTKICKELLHEPCPQEVLALDKKNVASREKIIK